jgi:hypothetical protein
VYQNAPSTSGNPNAQGEYQGEAKLMRCEHEDTLAKHTKDMLMGSTGTANLILPLSMVDSLRHQSIINMNKRIGY